MQKEPSWTEALEAGEWFADLQRRHRADGEVDANEALAEADGFRLVVFPKIVNTAECCEMGQTVMRRGPESDRAQRQMRDRAKRLGNVIPFPEAGHDPQAA